MSDANIQTVQTIYEAFGRGDVDTILDQLADDVDWAAECRTAVAPWHGVKHGKAEVPSFFAGIAEAVEVLDFTPLAMGSSDDGDVFVTIRFGVKSIATGKTGEMELHHWWKFEDGKVVRYRGTEDTAQTADLLAP